MASCSHDYLCGRHVPDSRGSDQHAAARGAPDPSVLSGNRDVQVDATQSKSVWRRCGFGSVEATKLPRHETVNQWTTSTVDVSFKSVSVHEE